MTMPFYVSPEQMMKDRADYARKGIARGRSVVVATYDQGIAFMTENPSKALHKISEIYDRIGFAAVGKYAEFEALRVAGIRYADLRGYSYDRVDVIARGLANAYAQTLGTAFTNESKPQEVELVVAQAGHTGDHDQIYRLSFDGSVSEEQNFVVIGGQAESLMIKLKEVWKPAQSLAQCVTGIRKVLGDSESSGLGEQGEPGAVPLESLEVAVLDRTRPRRLFARLDVGALAALVEDQH